MLDHERGEPIGSLGGDYVVVPLSKWADTTFYDQAVEAAKRSFAATGALLPIFIDGGSILVQEYPVSRALAFVFHRKIAGEDHYYPHVFEFSPGALAALTSAGRWRHPTTH